MSLTPDDGNAVAAFASFCGLSRYAATERLNKLQPEDREQWRRVAAAVLASEEERKRFHARQFGALVLAR